MCLGIPGKVIEINSNKAKVDMMGVQHEISIQLLENVNVGDYVIIHAGSAITKIDEEEAKMSLQLFKELGELINEK